MLSNLQNYLHGICAALERRKLLHTLYEVQQWSKDHVRAAMTCIRFYHLNAKTYSQLSSNINYLMYAQSHLEGALAVASASRKTSQSGCYVFKSHPIPVMFCYRAIIVCCQSVHHGYILQIVAETRVLDQMSMVQRQCGYNLLQKSLIIT